MLSIQVVFSQFTSKRTVEQFVEIREEQNRGKEPVPLAYSWMFLVLVYPLFSVAAGRLPTPQVVGPLSLSVAGGCCPSGTGRCS